MRKPGLTRLDALPVPDVWHASTLLRQYAVGPRSIVSVAVDTAALAPGDAAGLVLFDRPYAWFGVERHADGLSLVAFDARGGATHGIPVATPRVWLRAECDFVARTVVFSGGPDRRALRPLLGPRLMGEQTVAAAALECAVFCCRFDSRVAGGHATFEAFTVETERNG